MGLRSRALLLCLASATASAQSHPIVVISTEANRGPQRAFLARWGGQCSGETPVSLPPQTSSAAVVTPDIKQLLLDVEHNQRAAEAATRDYTYRVHQEQQEFDRNGHLKKTETTDSESVTIDGIRVNRVVARDGKPLTDKEAQKESDRIDKEVAKAKERRERLATEGKATNANGDNILTLSRILELGSFTNPRRIDLNGRPTIVLDYAGNPNAPTHNEFEKVFRDLVGTVWIDEQNRVLVRGEGHFLHDFKIGGGLVLNVHQGLSFSFTATHITDNIWLPATVDAQGSARFALFDNINGKLHIITSNYHRFHTNSTIIDSDRLIGPNGQPIPNPAPPAPITPSPPQPSATPEPPRVPQTTPAAPPTTTPQK